MTLSNLTRLVEVVLRVVDVLTINVDRLWDAIELVARAQDISPGQTST